MEMTDIEGQDNQGHGTSDKKRCLDHFAPERRCSVQKGFGAPRQHSHEHCSSLSNVEGLEDFEEFVLDFDDYDLLESIHTQLESTVEPIRKSCGNIPLLLLSSITYLSIQRALTVAKVTSSFR